MVVNLVAVRFIAAAVSAVGESSVSVEEHGCGLGSDKYLVLSGGSLLSGGAVLSDSYIVVLLCCTILLHDVNQ